MTGMMKYNFAFLALNGGLAYLISYLFSDSVVGKTPFPLTRTFKSILQRGVEVPNLDVSYISALSWYFLILFTANSYIYLILKLVSPSSIGAGNLVRKGNHVFPAGLAEADPMLGMAMGGGPSMGGGLDPAKAFGQEADNWRLLGETNFLEDVENEALKAINASE